MKKILLYSGLLIGGMVVSQLFDLAGIHEALSMVTMMCLAYIMVEVGLEFSIDKKKLGSYGWDYLVAATAAAFPWIFCAIYFVYFFNIHWKEALLIGRFAAPTSAGVLFAMLAAAGLGTTWLFRKAQILAIFDDLDTVLLMIPLQILFVGVKPGLISVVIIIVLLLAVAYIWLHRLKWPTGKFWLVIYGVAITLICWRLEHHWDIELEVLLPAFAMGCLLKNSHDQTVPERHVPNKTKRDAGILLDHTIKAAFMFLVGCSLPKIAFGEINLLVMTFHVVALTVLSNLGKCFPSFCYRKEASIKERIALSVALFPRGEVGAGVLLLALAYGLSGSAVTVAGLSLALNLLLTGVFIMIVLRLVRNSKSN